MKEKFVLKLECFWYKKYYGNFVAIRSLLSRPITDDELEWLISYGFRHLDQHKANVVTIEVVGTAQIEE